MLTKRKVTSLYDDETLAFFRDHARFTNGALIFVQDEQHHPTRYCIVGALNVAIAYVRGKSPDLPGLPSARAAAACYERITETFMTDNQSSSMASLMLLWDNATDDERRSIAESVTSCAF